MPQRVFRLIVSKLAPSICKQDTQFRKTVPADIRVAAVLLRLAWGANYFNTAEQFGVGSSTIQEFFPEVIEEIVGVLGPDYLQWPRGEAMVKVTRKFERACRLPNIQGALDEMFVLVRAPANQADSYFNRKWYTSLVLQAIANTDGAFLDVSCGMPGSVHDRLVLRRSRFTEKVESGEVLVDPVIVINDNYRLRPYILTDSGYQLESWMMLPFHITPRSSEVQKLSNEKQIRGRIYVERAFGILKARWQILTVGISTSIDWAARVQASPGWHRREGSIPSLATG
ncbi:hypothetical protein R1sor_026082 [Riccia sorocarpa]|uniref:DDE Tnp4 domain-containing protein n=1 Tax=Riccia sorocarpa TaxID=122646 RepID=A0ABD3GEE7_9MARC